MASIQKRGDSYRITVSAGYDQSGKQIRRSTTFHPDPLTATGREKARSVIEREVKEYAADFERQVKTGSVSCDGNMRFSELTCKYLEEYAFVELSRGTADGYAGIIKRSLVPAFGSQKIKDLCNQQLNIQAFYNNMAKPRADGSRTAPSTIRRNMAVFSSVMSWAVNMGLVSSNPLEHVKAPKEEFKKGAVQCFTIEELKRFIKALDTPQTSTYKSHTRTAASGTVYSVREYQEERRLSEQFKLFYLMAVFSGCRRGELLALEWNDLDFDAGTISITKSLSKTSDGLVIKSTKTSSGVRIINMPAFVMDLAKSWRVHLIEYRLRLGTAWHGGNNIFCQATGGYMYPDTVTGKFKDIIRNYNAVSSPENRLPEITLHGLRHTSASILINQHVDIATISKRLGHSRTSVTLDIYTHAIKEADKAAVEKLETIAKSAGLV